MGSVNMIVAVESIRSIISKKNDDLSEFHLPSIIAVSAALGMRILQLPYPVLNPHRHQVPVVSLQLSFQKTLESSRGSLGGPSERSVDQRLWYSHVNWRK